MRIINGKGDWTASPPTGADDFDLQSFANDFVLEGGVVDLAGGDCLVEELDTPGMGVKVAPGTVYVENSSWTQNSLEPRYYIVTRDAEEDNVSISSNPSGSTRIDLICQKIDKVTTPDNTGSNICPIVVVEGTPGAGAPATPNDHELLAEVEVEDGATSITNEKITDKRRQASVGGPMSAGGWTAANETWTYASADDPTYTFTISGDKTSKYSPGMRIKLTQTSAKYFIITKVEESVGTTTVTVYGGTDYDLANAAITNPCYSTQKAPYGFPLDPAKWSLETKSTTASVETSPTQNTWYNRGGSLAVHIGSWRLMYQADLNGTESSGTNLRAQSTLSTANNSESDSDFTHFAGVSGATGNLQLHAPVFREKFVTLTSKTTYYLNARTTLSGQEEVGFQGTFSPTIIRAVCAYL